MKWKLISYLIVLACVTLQVAPVMAAGSSTEIGGTVPLVASDVAASSITTSSATISWKTNGNATSQVFYDTVYRDNITDYRYYTGEDTTLVSNHSVTLTGLSSATTYHFRVKSVIPGTEFIAISDDYTFATLSVTGGGGGGGAPPPAPPAPITGTGQANWTPTATGVTPATITVTSPDNKDTVTVAEGTLARDNQGNPLSTITCNPPVVPAPSPPARNIVAVYDLGPSGATFSLPITVTMKYDPASLPAGAVDSSLILAFYNATTGIWIPLDNIMVDTVNHTVSGTTTHFTQFAVLANLIVAMVTTPTAAPIATPIPQVPAKFAVAGLSITPASVNTGETVTITATASNTGGTQDKYTVTFKVNGVVEGTKDVTVAAGGSEKVTFTTSKADPGNYTIDVNGQSGTFTVKALPQSEPTGLPTWSYILIGVGVVILLVVGYILYRRRQYSL